MLEIFKTVNEELSRLQHFEEGIWVNLTNPTEDEITKVSNGLKIDIEYLKAALDEEERARIEYENGQTLIIVDIPIIEKEGNSNVYTTIPLGIIIIKDGIVTVCLKENTLIKDFINKRIKSFYTYYKNRFILQLLYKNASQYLQYLRHIDKISNRIEQDLHKSMKNKELIQLLKLEKSLVYFSTSLKSNELVLEKMLKLEYIKKYPDDTDLLEDVIIENKQAIEMANIYSSILSGTMDAFASVISNNVNIVMKFLTSVTIVMAIPTMVASFYGMNVKEIPFAHHPHAFFIVIMISLTLAALSVYFLAKKKMF
ncbi:MAG: magnesium transporter CorA family protein [Clostridia bacterium]|nr:magnesium transporter CorA family protein [Clostridia bacterium]